MGRTKLKVGDHHSGLIIDGVAETPWVVGTIEYREGSGLTVEIPFIDGEDQFSSASRWFRAHESPRALSMLTRSGWIELSGCRWSGTNTNFGGISVGRIVAEDAVARRSSESLEDELNVTELRSRLDALARFAGITAISRDSHTDERGIVHGLTIEVESGEPIKWGRGDASMRIESDWTTETERPGIQVYESATLVSEFPARRSIQHHLDAQWHAKTLISIAVGSAVRFRGHEVRSGQFRGKHAGNGTYEAWSQLITDRTAHEEKLDGPSEKSLGRMLVGLGQIGSHGMEAWGDAAARWKRVVNPLMGLLGRQHAVEDMLISGGIALEAAGTLIGPVDGEKLTYNGRGKPSTSTHVFRCIRQFDLDWTTVASSEVSVARGVARAYNDVKHADRELSEDILAMYHLGNIAVGLSRLVCLKQADPHGGFTAAAADYWAGMTIRDVRDAGGQLVGDDGEVLPDS